ncbi:DUF6463 family protein [Streptomyces sp. NBC_00091]|uniref:DUF6463 family protein n=1 Tax=Streptomyces sp. NBC_00091 TaxID=2975648 RepID=UPI002252FFCA|nr:DUF6463 family protein [Streptomyces sp. NBC_00091]MCX5380411.1 DUF6463 family protein [Streptomyces sp. NBC_00091]
MSIGTRSTVTTPAVDATTAGAARNRTRTLTIWAGRSTVLIGIGHIAVFTVQTWSSWGDWVTGRLHGVAAIEDPVNADSLRLFWSLPGSFAVPLILLGLLIIQMARTGQEIPRYLAWSLAAWVLLCGWILEPSGFPLGLVPITLLLLAHRARPSKA